MPKVTIAFKKTPLGPTIFIKANYSRSFKRHHRTGDVIIQLIKQRYEIFPTSYIALKASTFFYYNKIYFYTEIKKARKKLKYLASPFITQLRKI